MGAVKGKVEHNPELILKLRDAFRSCKLDELVEELEKRMLNCVSEYCIYIYNRCFLAEREFDRFMYCSQILGSNEV